jgi:hypothetical protein
MRILLLIFTLFLLSIPMRADETYTFTGATFDLYGPLSGCPIGNIVLGGCYTGLTANITGSFSTDLALTSLENLFEYQIPNSDVTAFSFTNNAGVSISNLDATYFDFVLSTNSQAQIIDPNWGFGIQNSNNGDGLGAGGTIGAEYSEGGGLSGYRGDPTGNIWSGPVKGSAPAPTPEPGTILSFLAALAILGFVRRRGKEAA